MLVVAIYGKMGPGEAVIVSNVFGKGPRYVNIYFLFGVFLQYFISVCMIMNEVFSSVNLPSICSPVTHGMFPHKIERNILKKILFIEFSILSLLNYTRN